MSLIELLFIASGLVSTTYGYGEGNCGDVHSPRPCSVGAVTASGQNFDPELATVAIAAPARLRLKPTYVLLRVEGGECKRVLINDKMNERWIGERGFDLTPGAIRLLTGKPAHRFWSGKIEVCSG